MRHSPKALDPTSGRRAVLGRMPLTSRATAMRPDTRHMVETRTKVKASAERLCLLLARGVCCEVRPVATSASYFFTGTTKGLSLMPRISTLDYDDPPHLLERRESGCIGGHHTPPMPPAHSSSRGRRRFEKLGRPFDRLPGEMSSGHVPRVKSCLSPGCHRLASDVKPIDAKRDDRRGLRELAHPLVDPVGVGPNRSLHYVRGTTAGVPGPRIIICTGVPESSIAFTSSTVTEGRSPNRFCSSGPRPPLTPARSSEFAN
jgi:hypothetical protein